MLLQSNQSDKQIYLSKDKDEKFVKLFELRSTFKERYMKIMSSGKIMQFSDFYPVEIENNQLDKINVELSKGKKRVFYIFFYLVSALGYSFMYTRKLKRLNIPLKYSLYCWGFSIITILFSLRLYEVKMQGDFNKIIDEILIDNTFQLNKINNQEEKRKLKNLFMNELSEYKFLKYGNKNI